jgi:peptidyl-prolyl cis-trans isomerase B (cyclophilin B)
MRRLALASAVAVLLALSPAACGGDDDEQQANAPGCERVEAPPPKQVALSRPQHAIRPGARLSATIKTSCGTFAFALATTSSPRTTNSFAYLAQRGFYDGLSFNFIKPGFVQGGDPKGDRTGGPGYFVDEPPPANLAYTRGVVAMAKSPVEPPGRSGSQFFVVTVADAGLSPDYALLGRVTRGLDVIERIGSFGTPSGTPKQTVLIERVTVRAGGG